MDQEDGEHESRRGELPTEPRMRQAFIMRASMTECGSPCSANAL